MSALAARLDGESPVQRLGWSFRFDIDRYDRRVELTDAERRTLLELEPAQLRRSRARGADQRRAHWETLTRLVPPLDDARALLH